MQKILITGATGVLGQALVRKLTDGRFAADVAALGRDKEALQTKLAGSGKVKLYDLQELNEGKIDFSAVDCIIHCAFARSQNGSDLAASVEFSQRIFENHPEYHRPRRPHQRQQCAGRPVESMAEKTFRCAGLEP